jgi:hypothetical protein
MKPDPITAVRPCKSSGCPGKVYSDKNHGLCKKCHADASALVDQGSATWQGLAEMGLCEGETSPFMRAYRQLKGES